MKRLLSFLLALSVVAGLLAGITLTASAEGTIDAIHVTGVTAPAADALPTTEDIVVAPGEGVTYTAKWTKWNYEENDYIELDEGEAFAPGNMYQLYMEIALGENEADEEGIRFNSTVNGDSVHPYDAGYIVEENYVFLRKAFPVGVTMIDEIVIEKLPEKIAGASTAASGIVLPEGANYAIVDAGWRNINNGWNIYEGETLEEGGYYQLEIYLKPNAGCWFQNVEVKGPAGSDGRLIWNDGYMASICFTYDLRPVIDQVDIMGISNPVFGEEISAAGVKGAEGANYSVEAKWYTWVESEGFVEAEGTFGYQEYELNIQVTAPEGYAFTNSTEIMVDGVPVGELEEYDVSVYESGIEIRRRMTVEPENGYVGNGLIIGVPENVTVGADLTTPELTIEGEQITISNVQWVDADFNAVSGKVENAKVYYLAVTLKTAQEGTAFHQQFTVETEYSYATATRNADGTATAYIRYSTLATVDSVDVTISEPQIGAAPVAPTVDGDKVQIIYAEWYEYGTGEQVTQFEDNKKYHMNLQIVPVEGYEFAEDLEVKVNGEEWYSCSNGTDCLDVWYTCSFLTMVDRIDITVPQPVLGQTASVEGIQVNGEGVRLEEAYWTVNYGNEFTGEFQKSRYELCLDIVADAGYEITWENTEVYVNGVLTENWGGSDSWCEVYCVYSFRDKISKVELPALPEIKLGDAITDNILEAPEGAKFTAQTIWLVYDENGFDKAEGVFEEGKAYYLYMMVMPTDNYEFAEDAAIYIDGAEYTKGLINVDADGIELYKQYGFNLKVIDTVELTVPAPEAGEKPGEYELPEDALYEIFDFAWAVSDTDDANDANKMKGKDVFENGKYYWIGMYLEAKPGYVFAEDLKLVVNGKAMSVDANESIVIGGMGTLICNLGKLEAPTVNPEIPEEDENPKTGETASVALMASLLILSAVAAVAIVPKKKYNI